MVWLVAMLEVTKADKGSAASSLDGRVFFIIAFIDTASIPNEKN